MTLHTLETAGIVYVEEVRKIEEKILIADDVYALLQKAYRNVEGGLHFANNDELVLKTDLWHLVYITPPTNYLNHQCSDFVHNQGSFLQV